MNRVVQMFLNEAYRLYSRPAAIRRERGRWGTQVVKAGPPRVYYGMEHLPGRSQLLTGGLIKCQDLQERFPNTAAAPNLLYLVSSALPLHADVMVHFARQAGAGIVWNQNGVAYPAWHGRGWKRANAPMARLHVLADHVFYQSLFCKVAAETFLGTCGGRSEILHNPVDTDQFAPATAVPSLDTPILLIAGSHHFPYRIKSALDTLQRVLKSKPGTILMIAGQCRWSKSEAACQDEIRAYARQLGVETRLLFTGAYTQGEAPFMLQRAHVLVHTQYNDACPRLVVEAMACGLPVAYSATGGTPELVGPDAGIGVPGPLDWEQEHPPDVDDMASAVTRILDNYPVFRANARRRVLDHLSLSPWIERHASVFTKLSAGLHAP